MQKKIKSIESLFSISRDLAIGVYEGKIAFINPAAAAVFPTIQAGADARRLLPKELLDSGDEPRVISAHICGRPCTVSVSSMDGVQLMLAVISPVRTIRDRENTIVPPPLVTAMRIALSNIRLSGECFMKISDEPGSDAYRKQIAISCSVSSLGSIQSTISGTEVSPSLHASPISSRWYASCANRPIILCWTQQYTLYSPAAKTRSLPILTRS